ncbi:MAG: SDR family NAD(P)-dependent oxidoreductase, partial [Luminiphilus sp.]|nr:SDR family NAD(P)-dependent oxidoreductase [Luminiphilus sp.]
MDMNGKVAVVTGGASGIGQAVARRLAEAGGKIAIFDLNEDAGQAMVAELGVDNCVFANVNVVDEASVKAGIEATVTALGAIHVNVNCAGIGNAAKTLGKNGPFPLDLWNTVIAVNLTGTFNVLRLCAEVMAKNEPMTDDGARGVIINTASVAAYEGQMGQ